MNKKNVGIILALVCIVAGCLIPPTEALTVEALRFAGVFVGMLILLITQAMPDWTACLFSCCILVCLKVTTIPTVMSNFSGSTLWLIIMVFAFAAALGKTGILNRVALKILTFFPATYNGAVLALMCSGAIMNPMIPSANAKSNILITVSNAITDQLGIQPRSNEALGLFTACHMPTYICGNAFTSGSVYVAMMLGFITDRSFDMVSWFIATSIWFLVIMVATYFFCAIYCKPKEKLEISKDFYKERYAALGAMSKQEKISGIVLLCTIALWATSSIHGLDAGIVGLIAICIFVVTDIFAPTEWVSKVPWTMITFIGCVLGIAGLISSLGWSTILAGILSPYLKGIVGNPWLFVPAVCILTFLARFVIISQTTCLLVFIAIFGPLMEPAGMSLFVLIFCCFIGGSCWNNSIQTPLVSASIQVSGGRVTHAEAKKSSMFFMIIHTIACTASIPLWQALGLIW